MRILPFPVLVLLCTHQVFADNEKTWTSIEITVPVKLTDLDYSFTHARTMFGTPPQPINLTLDFFGSLLSPWGIDCNFCAGLDSYDPGLSLTYQDMNKAWGGNQPGMNGHYIKDTVGFEGLFEASDFPFVLMDVFSRATAKLPRIQNGHLGLYVNGTAETPGIFQQLWKQGSLMNPVMGMRWDPIKPRFTLGALDPEDYDGEINWVAVEDRYDSKGGIVSVNEFKIDGVKGFNGSLLPFGDHPTSVLHSFSSNIQVPPSNPYALNKDYTGPQPLINLYPDGGFAYQCNGTEKPYVHFAVSINGVDYPMDSENNMLRPGSMMSATGTCNVAIRNTTSEKDTDAKPSDFGLGLPFMRSVYVAYRFPTENCPGYYGFAFPSGLNRTRTQIEQKPTSTPDMASQCLSLTKPTSTPTPKINRLGQASNYHDTQAKGAYRVYGSDDDQVALLDAEFLGAAKWNGSLLAVGAK
jgi:hypothetical protein